MAGRQGCNLLNPEESTCPHCGKLLTGKGNHVVHVRACVHNPEVFKTVRALLDDGTGGIVKKEEYAYNRSAPVAAETLIRQMPHCSWFAVAEYFNLRPSARSRQIANGRRTGRLASSVTSLTPPERQEPVRVCGLAVCRVIDYGSRVGYVLR